MIDSETSPYTDTLTMCSVYRSADPMVKVILSENTRHERRGREGRFEVSVCSIGYRNGDVKCSRNTWQLSNQKELDMFREKQKMKVARSFGTI